MSTPHPICTVRIEKPDSGGMKQDTLHWIWTHQTHDNSSGSGCVRHQTDNYHPFRPHDDGNFELSKKNLAMSKAKIEVSSMTSKIFAGFAMAAAAELQTNGPNESQVPEWLWVAYVTNTTLLIVVHAFSLLISLHILPNIKEIQEDDKIAQAIRLKYFVEIIWLFSNLLGLFLFLLELGLLLWVKFWDFSINAAIAGMVIVGPTMLCFLLFAAYSYNSVIRQKIKSSTMNVNELENVNEKLQSYS